MKQRVINFLEYYNYLVYNIWTNPYNGEIHIYAILTKHTNPEYMMWHYNDIMVIASEDSVRIMYNRGGSIYEYAPDEKDWSFYKYFEEYKTINRENLLNKILK